jgi:hypothetical protein
MKRVLNNIKRLLNRRFRYALILGFVALALIFPTIFWLLSGAKDVAVRTIDTFIPEAAAMDHLSWPWIFIFINLTLTATFIVEILVIVVGLVLQKMTFAFRASVKSGYEEYYMRKMDPILLEDLPSDSQVPDSEEFRMAVKNLCESLRLELKSVSLISRKAHRRALRSVMIGMSRELVGETKSRLNIAFRSFGLVEEEIRNLSSTRWWIRADACRNISLMQAFEAAVPLVELLQDEEEDVRTEAAMALIHIAGVWGLEPLLSNVRKVTPWMSIQLSKAVIAMGSAAVPELIAALALRERSVKRFCVEMLGDIGDITACPSLTAFGRSTDEDLLCAALISLGKLADDTAQSFLLEYNSDPRESVRIHAARGMGFLASPMTASVLKEHLLSDKIQVRLAAGKALTRIEDNGRKTLIEAYHETHDVGRRVVLQFLEEIGVTDDELVSTQGEMP